MPVCARKFLVVSVPLKSASYAESSLFVALQNLALMLASCSGDAQWPSRAEENRAK
jgi:hypothetical protein